MKREAECKERQSGIIRRQGKKIKMGKINRKGGGQRTKRSRQDKDTEDETKTGFKCSDTVRANNGNVQPVCGQAHTWKGLHEQNYILEG